MRTNLLARARARAQVLNGRDSRSSDPICEPTCELRSACAITRPSGELAQCMRSNLHFIHLSPRRRRRHMLPFGRNGGGARPIIDAHHSFLPASLEKTHFNAAPTTTGALEALLAAAAAA
uniref:Uncharacterized protein n=1 Tax=Strigamia maritima TaxID=126957 RepID=T1J885_STRMM